MTPLTRRLNLCDDRTIDEETNFMTATIAGYGLAPPTLPHIQHALINAFGEAEGTAVWHDLCRQLELTPDDSNDLVAVERATQWLMDREDLGKVVGCSMSIRLIAFRELHARAAAGQQGADE